MSAPTTASVPAAATTPDILAMLKTAADRMAVSAAEADLSAHTFPNAPGHGDFQRIARDLRDCEAAARQVIAQATSRSSGPQHPAFAL